MQGTNVGSIYYDLSLDTKKFTAASQDISRKSKDIAQTIKKSLFIAGGAAVAFGVSSVKAYEDSQNKLTQLQAVLKSTGGVAGITSKQAIDLSKSLQKVTKFSDEEVLSAENLLLTFTNINKNIFPQTTQIVLDMSTALGQDLQSSAIQVGKALQDPILGVTALRRVGVNFNQTQQDTIKHLVDTNQAAKAQALILKELQREFGGSAEAAGKTFAGSVAILKNQINDLQESFGKLIVDAITPYARTLASYVSKNQAQLQAAFVTLLDTVKSLTIFFKEHARTIITVYAAYKTLTIIRTTTELIIGLKTAVSALTIAQGGLAASSAASNIGLLTMAGRLGPIGLGIAAVAGAGYGLYKLFQHLHESYQTNLTDLQNTTNWTGLYKGSVDLLTLAQDREKIATDDVKTKKQQLQAAQDALKGSTERLRAAGNNYNGTMLDEINKSLTVQILEGQLKSARDKLRAATQQLANWQDYLNGKISTGIKLVGSMKQAVNLQAIPAVNALQGAISNIQRNVGGVLQLSGNLQGGNFNPQRRATGGPVNDGTPYIVGEQGPELFVPRRSGAIMPAEQTAKMSGASYQTVINGPINIAGKSDADYLLNKLDRNSTLAAMGVSTI